MAPDGRVTQHGELAHERRRSPWAVGRSRGGHPYLRDDLPWRRTIDDAPWAHKDAYVLPTPEQAEATSKLIGWLASPKALGLDIPREWIGVDDGRVRMGRVDGGDQRRPGVYGHLYFGHADGARLILCASRLGCPMRGLRGGRGTSDRCAPNHRRLGLLPVRRLDVQHLRWAVTDGFLRRYGGEP